MHVIDVKPDPRSPKIVKTIEAEEFKSRAGYTRRTRSTAAPTPSTCRPSAVPTAARTAAASCCSTATRSIAGRLGGRPRPAEVLPTTSGGTSATTRCSPANGARPRCSSTGVVPERLLGREYGHHVHVWDLRKRRHLQALDLGDATRWCSSCGRRTTRARPTASWAWSSRSRICPRRSGCGTATGPIGRSTR